MSLKDARNRKRKHICFELLSFFMLRAFKIAEIGKLNGNIPIAGLIVEGESIIAEYHNFSSILVMHAEILLVMTACCFYNKRDLSSCLIFITHEPCEMCYQILLGAKIGKIFFSSYSDKKLHMRYHDEYYHFCFNNLALKEFFAQTRDKKKKKYLLT